ncbi:MAG: alkaline phosphatase D family protein [Pseudomonadales bacterium]|nr:alkaline phosphatase D family protein [Pseudomonadales bacterium]
MGDFDRRRFLSLLATGAATPFVMSMTGCGGSNEDGGSSESESNNRLFSSSSAASRFQNLSYDSTSVFPLSIASGDPSPSGVVLWTRLEPAAIINQEPLYIEVAQDSDFQQVLLELSVQPEDITELRDYTVNIDLQGLLLSGTPYYYRFIYNNTASRTGRCKTAPAYGTNLASLKMAVVTCQDYTNGYYGALSAIAQDESLDFVMHLGDFIYETAGDPRFQALPFEDRLIELPSVEFPVAMDIEDYRKLYRAYRSDPFLQQAMERHTWIITRDDHETGNDAYWDYANDTLGLPDHPYTLDAAFEANRLELLNQLMLDSHQAWLEYVPARVTFDLDSTDPHQRLKYYRHIQLGDLVDLFVLDGRSYRSAHPCGEKDALERYAPLFCANWFLDQDQTMLGPDQFQWLVNGLADSTTHWQLLGNQTFMAPIWFGGRKKSDPTAKDFRRPINVDAWDGFDFERDLLAKEIKAAGVENLVVLTGDLHSYIASHVKLDYLNYDKTDADNFVGVEFMTPSVTSAGLFEMLSQFAGTDQNLENFLKTVTSLTIKGQNPHIDFFNSSEHGYSTVEFTHDYCDWKCYAVDKDINDGNQTPRMLRHFRKEKGNHLLQNLT